MKWNILSFELHDG